MTDDPPPPTPPKLLEQRKALGFTTRRIYEYSDAHRVEWSSRGGRKSFVRERDTRALSHGRILLHSLWMPGTLNWWIGVIFAIGSLLFCAGSLLALVPDFARARGFAAGDVNRIFFAGSIPFTIAAYLQLFQAANWRENGAGVSVRRPRTVWFGWLPQDVGWLSSALQFVGTLLFNFNTYDALLKGLDWLDKDLVIWGPDIIGSTCFFISAYLAFAEESGSFFELRPRDLSWWITAINLLGCAAFLVSAIFAFLPPGGWPIEAGTIALAGTLIGAICFFFGAILLLPESYEGQTMPDPEAAYIRP